jgi:hypothetical protein
VPHAELNNPERYERNQEKHDTHGPFIMYSPDYGEGLNHPHIQSLKLKEAKGGYDGGQVKIREPKFRLSSPTRNAIGFDGKHWPGRGEAEEDEDEYRTPAKLFK